MPVTPGRAADGTPIAFVHSVLRAYSARDRTPAKALAEAQIAPDARGHWPSQVSPLQFERLCAAAMRELDDEAPGWFRRPLPWGSYGMLARASMGAPTLAVALKRWCRHHGLLTQDVGLALQRDEGVARIEITEHADLGEQREFALLSLLRNLHGLSCWWVDSQIALLAAHFPGDAPPHAAVYGRLFPGPVHFQAPRAALVFDAHYLDLPLRKDNAALDQMLRRALPILVWPYRRDRLLSRQVLRLLATPRHAQSPHTAETLAAELGLSARSLHRQLRAEDASVQQLKDQARLSRASDLLLRTALPVARIAGQCGFASDKSFARAFRHWTGQSPQQHRRGQSSHPDV